MQYCGRRWRRRAPKLLRGSPETYGFLARGGRRRHSCNLKVLRTDLPEAATRIGPFEVGVEKRNRFVARALELDGSPLLGFRERNCPDKQVLRGT
jgi:hypothetical protein